MVNGIKPARFIGGKMSSAHATRATNLINNQLLTRLSSKWIQENPLLPDQ